MKSCWVGKEERAGTHTRSMRASKDSKAREEIVAASGMEQRRENRSPKNTVS